MNLATIVIGIIATASFFLGYWLGRVDGHIASRRREGVIRLQAYKDGRQSVLDATNERLSMMAPELWKSMNMGIWTSPEKHETKERT